MGKNKRSKKQSYKPNTAIFSKSTQPNSNAPDEPQKRFKKSHNGIIDSPNFNEGCEIKEKVKVTDDMFEAAKLMNKGVVNIKDLDMSIVKRDETLNKQAGTAEITLIDIFQEGEIKVNKFTKPVEKNSMRFDFNDEEDFNPDSDSIEVARKAWNWLLNPLGFEYFKREIKDKKIMLI